MLSSDWPAVPTLLDTERVDRYFDLAAASYAAAEGAAAKVVRRHYRIAGDIIEFRFAGAVLNAVFERPLAHVEIEPVSEPCLTVSCWEQETSGVAMPPPPWNSPTYVTHGEFADFIDPQRYFQYDGRCGGVTIADRGHGSAMFWVRTVRDISPWEAAAPVRSLFNWWGNTRGLSLVHAGAVGYPSGGALLVGRAGAGKSHTALSCLQSDLLYMADDSCLIGSTDAPLMSGVYCSAKVYEREIDRFPILVPHRDRALRTPDDKLVFFLDQIAPDRLLPGAPLKVMLLPKVRMGPDTDMTPATPAEVLLALAPENVLRWPSVGREAFARLAAVVRRTPRYHLHVGQDLTQIPKVIAAAIRDARPALT